MTRRRADLLLVDRGLFESRARAQAAIEAGLVTADGAPVRKAADRLAANVKLAADAPHPWVSRGGVKLAAALDAFGLDPARRVCLDVGASTGGFTEVLLARGAAKVYAVDVGRGQLHARVAADPRVIGLEGQDARALTRAVVPEPIAFMAADVSFISLKLILPPLVALLAESAGLVSLVKPQFEAGRRHLKKGVVRDEAVHLAVCGELTGFVASLGFEVLGLVPSPVLGGDGNREFLLGARRG